MYENVLVLKSGKRSRQTAEERPCEQNAWPLRASRKTTQSCEGFQASSWSWERALASIVLSLTLPTLDLAPRNPYVSLAEETESPNDV